MALVLLDRVQELTTTSGTGTVTLNGAVPGFQDFDNIGNGNTTYYTIVDGNNWEVGIGTYSTAGTGTLSRDTVYESSTGSHIALSGNPANVFVTYPSEKGLWLDASGNAFVPNLGAATASSGKFTTLTNTTSATLANATITSGTNTFTGTVTSSNATITGGAISGATLASASVNFTGGTLTGVNLDGCTIQDSQIGGTPAPAAFSYITTDSVDYTGGYSVDAQFYSGSNNNSNASIGFSSSRGTPTSPLPSQVGDVLGNVDVWGGDGTEFAYAASIDFVAADNWLEYSTPVLINFNVLPVGTFSGTANTSGTSLTVTAVTSGALYLGMVVEGTGLPEDVFITGYGTGTGGVGTYTLGTAAATLTNVAILAGFAGSAPPEAANITTLISSNQQDGAVGNMSVGTIATTAVDVNGYSIESTEYAQNVGSNIINNASQAFLTARGTPGSPVAMISGDTIGNVDYWGYNGEELAYAASIDCDTSGAWNEVSTPTLFSFNLTNSTAATFVGSISGTTLTVTSISAGTIIPGQGIAESGGPEIADGTTIVAFITGTGGTGTYQVSVSQTVASVGMVSGFSSPSVAAIMSTLPSAAEYNGSVGNLAIGTLATTSVDVNGYSLDSTSYNGAPPSGNILTNSSFSVKTARGTSASPAAVISGDTIGNVDYYGYGTSGFVYAASIDVDATQNFSDTAAGTMFAFNLTPNGTVGPQQVATLNNDGTFTASYFVGNGSQITNLNLSHATSGVLPTSQGGTGLTGFAGANRALYTTSTTAITTGTLPTVAGGTGLTAFTGVGGLLYSSSTSAIGQLAPGSSGLPLLSAGSGNVPAYGALNINSSAITGVLPTANGGTGTSLSTGSGALVLATSPTLVAPYLGTPAQISLTNATGLALSTGVSGTLATSNGGTGLTSFTSSGAVYATSTSVLTTGTLPVTSGGTGVTSSTGSGSVVLSTSPALITPNLGIPSTVNLANATNLPLTSGVSGILPVANGGSGVSTATGSGSTVLSTGATMSGLTLTGSGNYLGTPASINLTNATSLALGSAVSGVLAPANGGTGVTSATGTGSVVLSNNASMNNLYITGATTGVYAGYSQVMENFTGSSNASLAFVSSNGTAATLAGATLGNADFWGYTGAAYSYAGSIDFNALHSGYGGTTWTAGSTPSEIAFNVTAPGSTSPAYVGYVTSTGLNGIAIGATAASTGAFTSLTVGGSTALTAANYTSYAPTLTGGGASGTWSINITGNAATATSATSASSATLAGNGSGSSFYTNGSGTENDIGVALAGYNNAYLYSNSSAWGLYSASGGSIISWTRANGYTNITGTAVLANSSTILTAANYNSYAPTLTGGGASGTWGISISGNAATATNHAGGAANQINYQTAASTTGFITAPTTASTFLEWNGSSFAWATPSPVMHGYLNGAQMSTAGSSTTMSIAAGQAADSTNAVNINLASAINKTTSAWVAGSGNGGLDTGSIAASTWYYFYLISTTGGTTDVVFSLNNSAPSLPSGYTYYRYIGGMITNASSQWQSFKQVGRVFYWATPTSDISATGNASANTGTLVVPRGRKMLAILTQASSTPAGIPISYVSDLDGADVTGFSATAFPLALYAMSNGAWTGPVELTVFTNTSAQIRWRMADTSSNILISTKGWWDFAGSV
jgi:hypothetical protein